MGLMFPIYFISLAASAGLTLMTFSQILDLSDLDCDYINPRQCCAKLNKLVLPEILCVGLLVGLHFMTFSWLTFSTTLPMLLWLIYSYRSSSKGYVNLFDATTIGNQKVLNMHVRRTFARTIYYVVHFIAFLYASILELSIA